MRNADTVRAIHQERGAKGLPLERVYKHLFNPELYLDAYGKIYRNAGAMTKGSTHETVDGMSLQKIQNIINLLKQERYHWTPVRRTEIPKANGKTRPLGIPTWSDKLVQEALRALLEPYYERRFSDHSHGFRPDRGCHTALNEVRKTWRGTSWFIEGDIKGCFDNIDHEVLLKIIQRDIHDGRLAKLIENLLQAGYVKDLQRYETTSGTPQGGIISPLLANIYLNELDRYIEDTIIPEYTRGKHRHWNIEYTQLSTQLRRARRNADIDEIKRLRQATRVVPSMDTHDPNYRRLRYVRYADDFLLGFAGPKKEAEEIRDRIKVYLQDELKLTLSVEKTLVTHASSDKAKFLGYEIMVMQNNTYLTKNKGNLKRTTNGGIQLAMPAHVVQAMRDRYSNGGKITHKAELLGDADHTIVTRYQSVLRGIYNYYCMATNVSQRLHPIRHYLEMSLTKTLASKHKCSVNDIYKKFGRKDTATHCLMVITPRSGKEPLIATFGDIPFLRKPEGMGQVYLDPVSLWFAPGGNTSEAVCRLLADKCEIESCGKSGPLQAHHIRKLADLDIPGQTPKPEWMRIMAARKRKTLMVCKECHNSIHAGHHNGPTTRRNSLESRVP